jgi:uncharacterized integral membrane protein
MKAITVLGVWPLMLTIFIVMVAGFLAWHFVGVVRDAMLEAEGEANAG